MDLIQQIVTLWVVIDPIGTIPVFIAMTAGMATKQRRSTALVAVVASFGVLLFFLVLIYLKNNSNYYFGKNTKAIKKNNKIPKTTKEKINNTKHFFIFP